MLWQSTQFKQHFNGGKKHHRFCQPSNEDFQTLFKKYLEEKGEVNKKKKRLEELGNALQFFFFNFFLCSI